MSDFNIDFVAKLARIDLSAVNKSQRGPQLDASLDYVAKLKKVNVGAVVPLARAFPWFKVTRLDVVTGSLTDEVALVNAPARAGGLFTVPKIVE